MYRHVAVVFFAALLSAEEVTPGITRGTLMEADAGFLRIRTAAGAVKRCGFDSHTWIERDRKRLQMEALKTGVPVEAMTDARAGRCYTRTLRLDPPPESAASTRRKPMRSSLLDSLYPRGNLTFAGVVLRRSPTVLVVRTRTEPEKVIMLREDTRFLDSGTPGTAEDLAVNSRVFIRAGKNFENKLEAFQIVWGEISGPNSSFPR